jgi:mannose-binding lectin 1
MKLPFPNIYQVIVPDGNNVGITAATPESPDSFEIFKTIVHYTPSEPAHESEHTSNEKIAESDNKPASKYMTSEQQFADLHDRLQVLHETSNQMWHEILEVNHKLENLANRQPSSHPPMQNNVQLGNIESRLGKLEDVLRSLQRSVDGNNNNYQDKFNQLQRTLESSHSTLTENLHGSLSSRMSSLQSTPILSSLHIPIFKDTKHNILFR